jgi:hypothetical protein
MHSLTFILVSSRTLEEVFCLTVYHVCSCQMGCDKIYSKGLFAETVWGIVGKI